MSARSPPTTPLLARNSLITDSLKLSGSVDQSLIGLTHAIGQSHASARERLGRNELHVLSTAEGAGDALTGPNEDRVDDQAEFVEQARVEECRDQRRPADDVCRSVALLLEGADRIERSDDSCAWPGDVPRASSRAPDARSWTRPGRRRA